MRSETSLCEWDISLKKDGSVIVVVESVDGHAGGGVLNNAETIAFKRFVFGEDYENKIDELKNPKIEGWADGRI